MTKLSGKPRPHLRTAWRGQRGADSVRRAAPRVPRAAPRVPRERVAARCAPRLGKGRTEGRPDMRFHATIRLDGKTATGIEVPADVLVALGPGKRPRVRVTMNGYEYPSTVGSMGGRSLIPVSA